MIPRDAAALLRHRAPALLLGEITAFDGTTLECSARGPGPWRWAQLLEGAAQAAGLLAGLQAGGPDCRAVIAEVREAAITTTAHRGPLRFVATLDRRLLGFWRCRTEVRGEDGPPLLTAWIAVAPAAHQEP